MPADTATPPATTPDPTPSAPADLPSTHQIPDTYFEAAHQTPEPSKAETPEPSTPETSPSDDPPKRDKPITAKEAAAIRRSKKEERKEIEAKAQTADELAAERDQMRAELETLRKERDTWSQGSSQWEAKQKEWETLQSELTRKVEEADSRYYDTYGPRIDLSTDEVYSKASTGYIDALASLDEIDGEPVFIDQLRANPETARAMDQAVGAYLTAKEKRDGKGMTEAVEQFAKALGAEFPDGDLLKSARAALKAAEPHAKALIARKQEIDEQGPQLAQAAWQRKHSAISDQMLAITRLDNSRIESLLADPSADITSTDYTLALANVLANEVPEWKSEVERELARDAESLALINAQLQPPPVMSKDPAEIAKHNANFRELVQRQGDIMRNAALGRVMAKALPALFAKLTDLETRADEAAANTNPGGHHQGGSSDPDSAKGGDHFGAIPESYEAHLRR